MDNNLQNYADLGKDLLKEDGHWDTALRDLEKRRKPFTSKWVIIGLALLATLIIGFLIFGNQKKIEPRHFAYFEAIPTSLVPNVRVDNGISKTDLQKAVIAYGDKNFIEAESLLTPLAKSDNDDLAKLYLASIYITQDKYMEATMLLNEIRNSDLKDYVQWNKAISLLPQDPDKAKILLFEIANNKEHFRSKKSKEILESEFGN